MNIMYDRLTDKELLQMTLDQDDEAMGYLLNKRYKKTLTYHTLHLFGNLDYLDDLIAELFCHLKGNDRQWKKLRSFKWESSFGTWLSTVSYNIFLKKRSELLDFSTMMDSIESEKVLTMEFKTDKNKADRVVMIYDAIAQLDSSLIVERDYKFVLIKDLEGFSAVEIATMLSNKRRKEKRIRIDKNKKEIIPDANYIYMIKSRAVKRLKEIILNETMMTAYVIDDELIAKYIDNKVSKTERKQVIGFITEHPIVIENMLYLIDEDMDDDVKDLNDIFSPNYEESERVKCDCLFDCVEPKEDLQENDDLFVLQRDIFENKRTIKIPQSQSSKIIERIEELLK